MRDQDAMRALFRWASVAELVADVSHRSRQALDLIQRRAGVDVARPDREAPGDARGGRDEGCLGAQTPSDLRIEPIHGLLIQLARAIAEATDRQRRWSKELQSLVGSHDLGKSRGEVAVASDALTHAGGADFTQHRPNHRAARGSGLVDIEVMEELAEVVEWRVDPGLALDRAFQVFRRLQRERTAEDAAIPDEGRSNPNGRGKPLVGIDDGRVRPFEAVVQRRHAFVEASEQSVRAVDVQPAAEL